MVATVLLGWLVLSLPVAAGVAALCRGGLLEDERRQQPDRVLTPAP